MFAAVMIEKLLGFVHISAVQWMVQWVIDIYMGGFGIQRKLIYMSGTNTLFKCLYAISLIQRKGYQGVIPNHRD